MTLRAFETYAIIGAWVIFLLLFVRRKRVPTHAEKRRDRREIPSASFRRKQIGEIGIPLADAEHIPLGPIG